MTRTYKEPPIDVKKIEPLKKWLDSQKNKKISVEIGCGVGLHPIRWAKANPDSVLVAFERTHEKFDKFQRRLEHHAEINNIFPVHGDALYYLSKVFSAESLESIFILYPNPYPKSGQKNLRWAHSLFLPKLARLVQKGGQLTLATNILSYADECAANFQSQSNGLLHLESLSEINGTQIEPRTHFEKKYLLRGDNCFNLVFRRA